MKKQRWAAAVLAALCTVSALPFTAQAAEPSVLEIDGERVALYSGFGKMSYNGKSYASYKTFNEALSALGKEGGKIVFTGVANAEGFVDTAGRGALTIAGMGTKSRSNILYFKGIPEVELQGDITLDFVNLRMDEGAFLFTNGHSFETMNEFDTYHSEQYVADGPNITNYENPPSVAPGTVTAESDGVINLSAGTYTTLAAGSVNGKKVEKDTFVTLTGGKVENVVAGNIGGGTMNGSAKLLIGEGEIENLTAGSLGGAINGNVTTVINGGNIKNAVIGAASGATVNGSVIVALNGGHFEGSITAGAGTVTGKKIIITGTETVADIASGAADYVVKLDGGLCEPIMDGASLTGFKITDLYGVPAKKATVNGQEVASDTGIYSLPEGTSTVGVKTDVVIGINRAASYVAGYSDGSFAPQNNLTRAEAITLLTRIITDENVIVGNVSADYADVAHGAWYESYIGLFQKLGYLSTIEGKHGAVIYPDRKITRAEFVELIYNVAMAGVSDGSMKLSTFDDVNAKTEHYAAIGFAVSKGIVSGYEDNTFRPEKNITRAEVAAVVNRFLGRIPAENAQGQTFADIEGHWAKSQILAAAGKENEAWTAKDLTENTYTLSGTSAKDYVVGLYDQAPTLSAREIRRGVDVISDQMKKNILNTGNTADYYDLTDKTIFYISEKNGNDENDGKSPETAWKTISALSKIRLVKQGKLVVLFERGGIYRGSISAANNAIYGSYGEGSKPILMQSKKNYADPSLWEETEWENVWKSTDMLKNVGVIGFDHDLFDYSDDSYHELYGNIMNKGNYGFKGPADLKEDLQFYSELQNNDVQSSGPVYLYCEGGNPGTRFKSIEMGERTNIFSGAWEGTIFDNLSLKFTGAHGIGLGTIRNITVTNCIFSWLGGSVLKYNSDGDYAVNYGNAVESYGGCNGYHVENNWMYQIYDTAVTHQRSPSTGDCRQENIQYIGNLMEYVHWGIEFYNAPPSKADLAGGKQDTWTRYTKDVHHAYNVLRMGGYGWGSLTRFRTSSARLYCGSTLSDNSDELAEYNIYDRCGGYLLNLPANANEVQDKNIYIQTLGCTLGALRGTAYTCDYDAARLIRDVWGDKNAVTIVIDPDREDPTQYRI